MRQTAKKCENCRFYWGSGCTYLGGKALVVYDPDAKHDCSHFESRERREVQTNSRGGARKGAGRKPSASPRCNITLSIDAEIRQKADYLRAHGFNLSSIFKASIRDEYKVLKRIEQQEQVAWEEEMALLD